MLEKLLLCLAVTSAQRAADSTSTLTFQAPQDLAAAYPYGVNNSQAMFGSPNYGSESAIRGILVYAASGDHDACQPFSKENVTNWPSGEMEKVIVMLDRGTCTFVTKVRHAQEAGAFAAVILDNVDDPILPLMADDGSGGDILIPSILIHKDDGAKIRPFMKEKVRVIMEWNLPHPDGRVEWDFWTSADDQSSMTFKQQFRRVSVSLGTHAKMTPHYFFIDGRKSGCSPGSAVPACQLQCINDGRYCANDPEQDLTMGLSGAEVAEENLRQMCLWKVHLDDDADPSIWFDYVTQFDTKCATPEMWNADCSTEIISGLNLDPAPVIKCVEDATDTEGANALIEAEIKLSRENGVFFNPTILINNKAYRGTLSCPDPIKPHTCGVLSAICDGYEKNTEPAACFTTDCDLGQVRDDCGVCGGTGNLDDCGDCFQDNSSSFYNQRCAGCDGVPRSGLVLDNCGVCAGPGHDLCGECFPEGDERRIDKGSKNNCAVGGFPTYGIVLIVLGIILVGNVGVVYFWNRREAAARADIDSLLQNYITLDAEQSGLKAAAAREIQ